MCRAKGYGERSLRPKHNTAQMKACCLTPLASDLCLFIKKEKKKKKESKHLGFLYDLLSLV